VRRFLPFLLFLSACAVTPRQRQNPSLDQADKEFLAGNYSQAAHLYEQALGGVSVSERPAVLAKIGKCLLGAGDAVGAASSFSDALAAGPSSELRVEIHYRRALAFNAQWRPLEALADLNRVREAPESVRGASVRTEEFLYRLGVTSMRACDWRGGQSVLRELIAKFPAARESLDAKDRVGLSEFRVQIGRTQSPKGAQGDAVPSAQGGYVILVGHFSRLADARAEMERLRQSGHADAFVVP
jgi:tetratricopeptide (TPR) repeat protein